MNPLMEWISKNPGIAVAVISGIFTILGGLLTTLIWPLLKTSFRTAWDNFLTYLSGKKFEHRYLDWVIKEHQFLPILPTTLVPVTAGRHQQELERLYVSLTLAKDSQRAEEASFGDALHNYPRLVILGNPGAGKTTMLRFLALTVRPGS